MKTVFQIAKAELKTLFYSPIAWFLLIIFFIQAGVAYFGQLDPIARMQDSGVKLSFSLTNSIFFGRGVFNTVMQNLYLYLPLLTMGLISREMSSGTIRLLYSSPIKVSGIVLGKFLSILALNLLLTLVVIIYILITYCFIPFPDTGHLLASLLGLFLLLCAYAAIGIFMSCLTNYQVVAAVCTFVAIWVLHSVGSLWQDIPFVRNLTYFLSLSGRSGKMMQGLITSKDLIYFAVIIYMFLSLSIYKLRSGMESRSAWYKTGRYLIIIGITLGIGYVSSIPQLVLYLDTTRNHKNTIVPPAQKILRSLGDEPLEVTSYTNLLGGYFYYGSPDSYNRTLAKWEPYLRFKHSIQLKNIYYYDTLNHNAADFKKFYPGKNITQIAEQKAESSDMKLSEFLKPAEIRKIIDLSQEPDWYTMQLKYKGRTTLLRLFDDNEQWPTETEVAAALKRLLNEKMPKILFVTGELERNIFKMGDRDFKGIANLNSFRYSLLNQGFDVDTISLENSAVPTGINALVLADPKQELSTLALQRLQAYTDAGGNLMILGEPGKQSLLNPYLKQFGIQLLEGTILQKSKDLQQTLATPILTEAAASLYPRLAHAHHYNARVSMPGAAPLSITATGGSVISSLLLVDTTVGWLKKGAFVADSVEINYMPDKGDHKAAYPVAVSVTRKVNGKEQRIIVSGDADFMSNTEMQRNNVHTANFAFSTGLFSWLSYGTYPIDSSRPEDADTKAGITKDQVKLLRIAVLYGTSAILVLLGSILLIRRKRK
jgi:ABC-2 type transport system permease protein